jgi:hypothetical protein
MNLSLGGFACQRYRAAGEPVLWCLHDEDNTARGTFHPHQWPEGAGPTIMQFFASLLLVQPSGSLAPIEVADQAARGLPA